MLLAAVLAAAQASARSPERTGGRASGVVSIRYVRGPPGTWATRIGARSLIGGTWPRTTMRASRTWLKSCPGGRLTRLSCAPLLTADKAAALRCSQSHASRLAMPAFEPGADSHTGRKSCPGGRLTRLSCAPLLTADKAAALRCSQSHASRLAMPAFEPGSDSHTGLKKLPWRPSDAAFLRSAAHGRQGRCAAVLAKHARF